MVAYEKINTLAGKRVKFGLVRRNPARPHEGVENRAPARAGPIEALRLGRRPVLRGTDVGVAKSDGARAVAGQALQQNPAGKTVPAGAQWPKWSLRQAPSDCRQKLKMSNRSLIAGVFTGT
jgi:hypothetical protein